MAQAPTHDACSPRDETWPFARRQVFLDNAPTYLVFFELAGGDAEELMTTKALYLKAIPAGAVFFGAISMYSVSSSSLQILASNPMFSFSIHSLHRQRPQPPCAENLPGERAQDAQLLHLHVLELGMLGSSVSIYDSDLRFLLAVSKGESLEASWELET